MVSNLQSARQAIQAELSHARQGIAYYASRVEALEVALDKLESVEGEETASTKEEKRKAGKKATKPGASAHGRKTRAVARRSSANGASKPKSSADDLPTTGGEFWLGLVGSAPQTAVDISNAAIRLLGIKSDQKMKIRKLKQRVAPALAGLVAAHKIKDSGAGRERRFYKENRAEASG